MLLSLIRGLLGSIRRTLSPSLSIAEAKPRDAAQADPADAGVPRAIAVPAVAGFVMREKVDRFLLARRLASIATLNTPIGRKPRTTARRSRDLPQIPAARLGAKRTRLAQSPQVRIVRPALPQGSMAPSNIVTFPLPLPQPAAQADHLAKAA